MNNEYNYILFLARSFFRLQGPGLLSFINNYPFPLLAQSFLRAQGLGSAESAGVLLYIEHFGLCRIRRDRKKEPAKCLILSREYGIIRAKPTGFGR